MGTAEVEAYRRSWQGSEPFPHLVIDDFVSRETLARLRAAATEEPLLHQADEHFQFRGSSEPPTSPVLQELARELSSPQMRETLHAITGLSINAVSLRAYRYLRGDYLLPHTDCHPRGNRLIAFAFYLGSESPEPLRGGELSLYRCTLEGDSIAIATEEVFIASRPNRIALFAVSPKALHRVHEVMRGERLSLAGWFLA